VKLCLVVQVFETFGPVQSPLYSVRFNSKEHIAQHQIEIGAKVFCVPNVSEWTHYVFLEHLRAYVYVLFCSHSTTDAELLDQDKIKALHFFNSLYFIYMVKNTFFSFMLLLFRHNRKCMWSVKASVQKLPKVQFL